MTDALVATVQTELVRSSIVDLFLRLSVSERWGSRCGDGTGSV